MRRFEYRYDQTIDMPIAADQRRAREGGGRDDGRRLLAGLEERVREEFAKSGIEPGQIAFTHAVRMQYYGQLNDIEIVSPHDQIEEASEVDDLIAVFEEAYGKVFARSARSPELGYLITHAIVLGSVEVEKPALPDQAEAPGDPPTKASRRVWWQRAGSGSEPAQTDVYELRRSLPATRSRGRRSSSRSRRPSRFRRAARPDSIGIRSFT